MSRELTIWKKKLTPASLPKVAWPTDKNEGFAPDPQLPGHGIRWRRSLATGKISLRWQPKQKRLPNGEQPRGDFGDALTVDVEVAREACRQWFGDITLGRDPSARKKQERAEAKTLARIEQLRLDVVLKDYLAWKETEVKPSTFKEAQHYLKTLWQPLHDRAIDPLVEDGIKRADVARVVADIARTRGKTTGRAARSNLNAFYIWAVQMGLCDVNPVTGTLNPAKNIDARERVLSDAELAIVWHACQNDTFGRLMRLLILNPCRRDELGDLAWHEVNLATGVLIIPASRTKNKKALVLTLAPASLAILKSIPRREGQPYVFGSKPGSRPLQAKRPRALWQTA